MLEVLLFAAVLIAIAQLWSRMTGLEQRLRELEHHGVAAAALEVPFERGFQPSAPHPESITDASPADADFPHEDPLSRFERARQPIPSPLTLEPSVPEPLVTTAEEIESPTPDPVLAEETEEDGQGGFGFEELFGRRLPIWAGGVTLAVAGVLIVRYSIEAGLLSPLVRVLFGMAFGAGLIAAAEAALRNEERVRDRRVPQSLAGAGIASLYASILVAVNLYALIGPLTAFLGMAVVTALALGLSLRFGAPSALLGLLGGLAAPALVGAGEPNVPLLSLYLALAVGGLSALARAQRWAWLGISALVGGLGWGALLLLGGALDAASTLSIGVYILLVGIFCPLVALSSERASLLRFVGGAAAAAQMAALVATGGFALLNWGLFGLISIAILVLARREEGLHHLPLVALGIALLLLGAWTDPAPGQFALVLLATAAIYAGPLLVRLWIPAGDLVEAMQLAGLAIAATLLSSMHFYRPDGSVDLALAAVALAAACLPAVAALLGWRQEARRSDARFALLSSTSALLVAVAAAFAAPLWLLPVLVGAIAVLMLFLALRADDERVEWSAWLFAVVTVPLLPGAPVFLPEFDRLLGLADPVRTAEEVLRWSALGAVAALFSWRGRLEVARAAAQAATALFLYGALAQFAPASLLPLVPAAALLGAAAWARRLGPAILLPAMATLLALSAGWAALPLVQWLGAMLPSLIGDPVLVPELPRVRDVLLRLLAPAVLIFAALRIGPPLRSEARQVPLGVAAAFAAVALHILYKQLFAIGAGEAFVRLGLAERTLWEGLLLAGGAIAWTRGARLISLGLCTAGLAHFGLYTLLLHNPLWATQAVGSLPVLNLLLPGYALPLALLWSVRRFEPEQSARVERPRALLQMLLVLLLAFSSLRQLAEGTILSGPGLSAGEDIARSILAILLAIGFLLWGLRSGARDWRIASLVLMLGAVAKVFLLDASGLEGLMRIGSFVALGISLIGIGWLYSRSLGGRPLTSSR